MMDNTILLVDDEEDIRFVLDVTLSDSGYRVFTATNGEEGLDIFRRENPPIVLTDIKMPGMDGIELLRRIKRENPETEVIMITGHGDMDLAIKSLQHEATDFITKPINDAVLEIALKRANEKIVVRQKLQEYTASLERLVREKTELQDHLSSLGLMIGSISHGIKGLLTGLDGGMYLLDRGFKKEDQDQIKEGWEIVRLMIGRIRKMVLDILFYAKDRDLKWERIDALSFAREVARAFGAKIQSQAIAFSCEFEETLGEFEVDAGMIHSVLINILDNAVDACTRDSGKASHRIAFSARQTDDHVLFDVEDDGIGMDADTRDKIFSLFFSTKGNRGTGLGLFVSNKIIEQHGGAITVKSTPGRGSKFSIRIPKILPPSAKAASEEAPE